MEGNEALSVGEDFVLLSSAKFAAGKIEVTERVGLDLILPIAAMLPLTRHIRWVQTKLVPAKVAENLLIGVGALAAVVAGSKVAGSKGGGKVAAKVTGTVTSSAGKAGPIGLFLKLASVFLTKEVLESEIGRAHV